MLTTIEVEILKRFGDFTKSIKRRLVVKQGLKPSRLLSKGRLNYPWEVIQSKHIPWGERHRFRTLRRDVVPAGALNEPMSLSQSEVMCSRQNGVMGGGRKPFGQVHVLKVSHHGAIPAAWSRAMHVLKR